MTTKRKAAKYIGLLGVVVVLAIAIQLFSAEVQTAVGVLPLDQGHALLVTTDKEGREGIVHRVDSAGELVWTARLQGLLLESQQRMGFALDGGTAFVVTLDPQHSAERRGFALIDLADGAVSRRETPVGSVIGLQPAPLWARPGVIVELLSKSGDGGVGHRAEARDVHAVSGNGPIWQTDLAQPTLLRMYREGDHALLGGLAWQVLNIKTGEVRPTATRFRGDVCLSEGVIIGLSGQHIIQEELTTGRLLSSVQGVSGNTAWRTCGLRGGNLVVSKEVSGGWQLARLNATTGQELWSREWLGGESRHIYQEPDGQGRRWHPLRGNVRRAVPLEVMMADGGDTLVMLDMDTGAVLWRKGGLRLIHGKLTKGPGLVHYWARPRQGRMASFDSETGRLLAAVRFPPSRFRASQVTKDACWLIGSADANGFHNLSFARLDPRALKPIQVHGDFQVEDERATMARELGLVAP